MTPLALAVDLAIAALFAVTLVTWLRRRDGLSRDVMLIFASLAGLFVIVTIGSFGIRLPQPASAAVLALLFAQPVLTLRLASRIRPVPRVVLAGATVFWAVTALPSIVLPGARLTMLAMAGLAGFILLDLVAGAYLGIEAKKRVGSARLRLAAAAIGSAMMAVAIAAALLVPALTQGAVAGPEASRVFILLAALLYGAAFALPGWARRVGNAVTAFTFTEHLLDGSSMERPAEIWSRLAGLARRTTGASAVVVVAGDPRQVVAVAADDGAAAALSPLDAATLPRSDASRVLGPDDGDLGAAAAAIGARFATVLPFDATDDAGCLVLLHQRQSIFAADDHDILVALVRRARVFAERSEALRDEAELTGRLGETVAALERASQAKSDFLASMSHELRTPLSAIIGFSALMRDEPLEDGRRTIPDEWITHIRRSGDHLLALINDVLDLTKIEAGRTELVRERFDLSLALAESVEGLRPLADRKDLELVLQTEPGIIDADRGRLRQMLYNLLSNAIKFTPEGGRILVEGHWFGNEAVIAVSDTGVGIAPEDLDRIFEEFRQVGDTKGREAGTGLGLALTRRLAEAHGGRIEVTSASGAGSRFEIRLPDALVGTTAVEPPAAAVPHAPNGATVLVIEDDLAAVRLMRTYLESDGYSVVVAPDGETGIAAAHLDPPDAIVLDVLLPGVDGWEVLRRLKADPALRDIPVLVATIIDERNVAMNLGAADYFLKPVQPDALLARLATYTLTTKVKHETVRVLVIDDDPAARELVVGALRPEGFEVAAAATGEEGLRLAETQRPDLIICDLLMPGMDGFEVVRHLSDSDTAADVPVLILTGQELSSADRERLRGHVTDVLQKGADVRAALGAWLLRASRASRRRPAGPSVPADSPATAAPA